MSLYVATIGPTKGRIITDGRAMRQGRIATNTKPKALELPGKCLLVTVGSWTASDFSDELSAEKWTSLPVSPFTYYAHRLLGYAQSHSNPDSDDGAFLLIGAVNGQIHLFWQSYVQDAGGVDGLPEGTSAWVNWHETVTRGVSLTADGFFSQQKRDEIQERFRPLSQGDYEHAVTESEKIFHEVRSQNSHCIGGDTFVFDLALVDGQLEIIRQVISEAVQEAATVCSCSGEGSIYNRVKAAALDGNGNPMTLGNNSGDFLKFDGTGTGSIYNSSGTLIAAATKRHVPTVPFSQTNAANANDGETVFFNSGSGTPFLQDSNGNAFPVFANAPGVVLQTQNPPAGLASFYAANITPTSFKVVSKGSGALTNYGITLSDQAGLINVTGGTNTTLDTSTDAYNTNVTQASGVTTQVQFSVSISTILSETSGRPDFGGIYNFVCQVWSGNMGTKLAEGSFSVTVRSTGGTFSNGATLAALSIAASSQFTVRIYQSSNSDNGAASGTTASATGGYTAASSINGVDFTALIIEPWA